MLTKTEERPSKWSLVLNNPLDNPSGLSCKKVLNALKGIYPFIAVILHNDDYDDDGNKKTEHYHLILESNRIRKSTLLKNLSKLLEIPENCISCKEVVNWRSAVRYITHIDYPDKTLYPPYEIYTNDQMYLNSFFTETIDNMCEERLIAVVREEKTTAKILMKIGKENYKKYALIIRDLQKEVWNT